MFKETICVATLGVFLSLVWAKCFDHNCDPRCTLSMVCTSYVIIILLTNLSNIFKYFNDNETTMSFSEAVDMPKLTLCLLILCGAISISMYFLRREYFSNSSFILTFCTVFLLIKINDLDFNEVISFQKIQELELTYGAGLAHGFYHGYLKIVLPDTGMDNGAGGLLERLQDYENTEKVKISKKKLFILIPMSGHLPPQLDGTGIDDWIEARKSLPKIQINRAGVKRRPYVNTIYVIRDPHPSISYTPYYVAMEGATPLKTLDEACGGQTFGASKLREQKRRIIIHFYNVLKNLLENDKSCRHLCELVYYDDTRSQVCVGKMIYERYLINNKTKH